MNKSDCFIYVWGVLGSVSPFNHQSYVHIIRREEAHSYSAEPLCRKMPLQCGSPNASKTRPETRIRRHVKDWFVPATTYANLSNRIKIGFALDLGHSSLSRVPVSRENINRNRTFMNKRKKGRTDDLNVETASRIQGMRSRSYHFCRWADTGMRW